MPSITDSIGRVLGDRYRLVSALGTGASAHVYLADDVSLHRRVAIKVLHPALAGDTAFLKRFRAEARAVAALNHPNILQVYDWGEEDGSPYLVLEYLAGGSLRQVYDTGTLLTPEQAVHIGLQATAGLDYAHRRGLVHRDIKPANLLFDADSRLRIADFGLARALAEAAWTEPDGAILGTARYAAPEQVEGWTLDGKADVYALAIVLYEGVTGQVPFAGDTTVATLMARVGTLLPEHEALGPLNEVLVWAAAPEPEERYDAAAFALRLRALALALPEPGPLPLVEPVPPTDDAVPAEAAAVTTVVAAVRTAPRTPSGDTTELGVPGIVEAGEPTRLVEAGEPTRVVEAGEPTRVVATGDGGPPDDGAEAAADPDGADGTGDTDGAAAPAGTRRRWPWLVGIAAVVVALVAGGVALAVQAKLFTPSHPVPVLVGRTVPAARQAVAPLHFTVHQTGTAYSITLAAGLIVTQQPGARSGGRPTSAKEGTTIAVVVSRGVPPVAIPSNLATYSNCGDAIKALQNIHLVGVCPASAQQYSSTVPAGAVLGSNPATTAPYGSTVTIITSKGHAPVAIPAVTGSGSTYASASAALTAAGLVPAESKVYSSTVPSGEVVGTAPDPSGGLVAYGSTVTVDVSLGPKPVIIPDVVGDSVNTAVNQLQALGLKVTTYGPSSAAIVVYISPGAGTSVLPGSSVTLDTI
jgi:serine/threonine-protein kinase